MARPARSIENIPVLTETQKAWIGGFLDGEGHFGIQQTALKKNGFRYFVPILQVSQAGDVGIKVIEDLQKELGGIGTIQYRNSGKVNHRPSVTLMLYGKMVIEICKQIVPYLRVKTVQANILINWPSRRTFSNGQLGTEMDVEVAAIQEFLFGRMRELNGRVKNAEA